MKRLVPYIVALGILLAAYAMGQKAFGADSRVGINVDRPVPYSPSAPTINAALTGEPKLGGYVWNANIPGVGGTYTLVMPSGVTTPVKATDAAFQYVVPPGAKLLRPGYTSDAGTFTADFLASKRGFGIIRLMNWAQVNDATVVRWADRAKVTDPWWSDPAKGAPLEPWLDHAKRTGQHLWINVPLSADDDYIENLAKLCGEYLKDTNVHVYPEHGNEVWASTPVGRQLWALSQAQRRPRLDIHADRTVLVDEAFKRYLPPTRVHTQLGMQLAGYAEGEAAILKAVQKHGKGHFDISVAGYLGKPGTPSDSTPQGYASCLLAEATRWRDQPETSSSVKGFRKWKALADRVGCKLTAYEYGLDLAFDRDIADRAAAQYLPDAAKAVGILTDVMFREGFDVARYYKDFSLYVSKLRDGSLRSSGFFGLSNKPKASESPKHQAAVAAAAKYPLDDVPDIQLPPPAPSNLTLDDSGSRLVLRWGAVPRATYKLYRDGVMFDVSTNTDGTSDKTPGVYHVTAVANGKESDKSNVVPYALPDPNAGKRARIAEIDGLLIQLTAEKTRLLAEIGE